MKSHNNRIKAPSLKRALGHVFYQLWWVFLILVFIGMLHYKTFAVKNQKYSSLLDRLNQLQNEKFLAMSKKKHLTTHLNSLEDPRFVEMVLMEKLGLVPDESIKVSFKKQENVIESEIDN